MYATRYAETVRHGCLQTCICAGCTAIRPTFHCPVTQAYMTTSLPVDFRQVGRDSIWPPHWWNGRLQAHEEEWLVGQLEAEGSSTSESRASTTVDSDIDGVDDNLPGIHTLGLWEIKPVAARHPDPSDRTIPATTASSARLDVQDTDSRETAQHQLPSPSAQTLGVPEQDSPCDTQGESRRDNHERGRERSQGRDSASLRIELVHFDKDGRQLKPKMSNPLELAESRRKKRQKERERKRGTRDSASLRMVFVRYDKRGKRTFVKDV